jgi:hypothetical protein
MQIRKGTHAGETAFFYRGLERSFSAHRQNNIQQAFKRRLRCLRPSSLVVRYVLVLALAGQHSGCNPAATPQQTGQVL